MIVYKPDRPGHEQPAWNIHFVYCLEKHEDILYRKSIHI